MIRTFIAVELPEALRRAARGTVASVERAAPGRSWGVSWVREGSMHLTLKFIGYAAEESLPPVKEALARAAARVPSFDAEFAGLGAFPGVDRPRIVWVGMSRGGDRMTALRDAVEAEVSPLGFPTEDRKFHPHVTLGRVKDPRCARLLGAAMRTANEVALGAFRVDRLVLFKSDLRPSGAVHTALDAFELAETRTDPS